MALFSAFFSFNSPRCLHSRPLAGVCWLRERGPPACSSGSALCQGRRGREEMPGKSVIPTGLPCRTSHSSARVAFPLAFLGSFPPKESSSVELLSALCCGFLALTSQALSILHSGYFKRGSFVTKTGSCSCRRNKSPFDSFSALFPQLLVISKSEAYPFSCLMSLVSFIYENTAAAAAKSLQSCVRLCATPETAAHQAPPYPGFSRREHWSGLPFPSPVHESEKWKWSRSVVSDSSDPMDCSPPGSSVHGIF